MAAQGSGPDRSSARRQTGKSGNAKRAPASASNLRVSSAQLEGRPPSGEPDVHVDVPKVKVDEIYLDVERLEAHLALRAKLANLLQVVAGVHVNVGKVEIDIKGVEAEARVKVRLENLYDILDRALTTLDRNPQILESLVNTVDDTVGSVGDLGEKAMAPGGAGSQTLGDVGQATQQAVRPGGAASEALGGVGNAAGQAMGPGGAVGQAAGGRGQAAQGVGQEAGGLGQGLDQTAGNAVGGVAQQAGQSAQAPGQPAQAPGQSGQSQGGTGAAGGQGDGRRRRPPRQTKRGSNLGSANSGSKRSTRQTRAIPNERSTSRSPGRSETAGS